MHADHVNMVKFRSGSDDGYKAVDYIQFIIQDAPVKVGSQWEKGDRVKDDTRFSIH
jgi:hypothetical protein